jgi:hypothetical protein
MADPRVIDLDAARAARAETTAPVVVRFGGTDYSLPSELPIEAATSADDPMAFLRILFGDSTDKFLASGASVSDLEVLATGVAAAYGFESVPESSASGS